MAGIEPAATTLAGRVRYLSCHPRGAMRRPVQPVPGCSWALFRRIAHMVLTLLTCQQASTFTLGWCFAGTAGVEPAFRSGWSRTAYPLADPQANENRPGISLGRLPSRGFMASDGNRPGAQGKLALRGRVHVPASLGAFPERHDSMVRGTHVEGNAIFVCLLPGRRGSPRLAPRIPDGTIAHG
jgi:hypothetical protein